MKDKYKYYLAGLIIILILSVTYGFIQSSRLRYFESRWGTYKDVKRQTNENMQKQEESRLKISIALKPGTSNIVGQAFLQKISTIKGIKLATYTSPEKELEAFREVHFEDKITLEALDKMGLKAFGGKIHIQIETLESKQQIISNIKQMADFNIIVDKMNYTMDEKN